MRKPKHLQAILPYFVSSKLSFKHNSIKLSHYGIFSRNDKLLSLIVVYQSRTHPTHLLRLNFDKLGLCILVLQWADYYELNRYSLDQSILSNFSGCFGFIGYRLRWSETKKLKISIPDNIFFLYLIIIKLCTLKHLKNIHLKLKLIFS